MTQKYLSYV